MRAVIQRVSSASVVVEGQSVASIGPGLLILLGVARIDSEADGQWLAEKIPALRIFPDDEAHLNRSLLDISGELLVVSQFTLLASTRKGTRPSFNNAAPGPQAQLLYEAFLSQLERNIGRRPQSGRFGADMKVTLVNDGPVTLVLDSQKRE